MNYCQKVTFADIVQEYHIVTPYLLVLKWFRYEKKFLKAENGL